MAKNIQKIAEALGADRVRKLPETGGGAFGAARIGKIVAALQNELRPSEGKRPGRPTKAEWSRRPKIAMSEQTERRLIALAKKASSPNRKVSAMQLAARLLEEALRQIPAE